MKLQLSNRDLSEKFKAITDVVRLSGMRYETAIGSTTVGIYEMVVDAVEPMAFVCTYQNDGPPEECKTEIYTIAGRFFIKDGQELSAEQMTQLRAGEVYLHLDFVTWQNRPMTVEIGPKPWCRPNTWSEWHLLHDYMPGGERADWFTPEKRRALIDQFCDEIMTAE